MSQDGDDGECHRMALTRECHRMAETGNVTGWRDGECHRMAVTGNVTGWR